jgi:hypothetical protein
MFLCCLWSFSRLFVRAAAGRQRFNVLGAWNAITLKLVAEGLTGWITLVLANARY